MSTHCCGRRSLHCAALPYSATGLTCCVATLLQGQGNVIFKLVEQLGAVIIQLSLLSFQLLFVHQLVLGIVAFALVWLDPLPVRLVFACGNCTCQFVFVHRVTQAIK